MKYSTDLTKNITFEDIVSKVTEYDIFRYYMESDFKLNQIMSSPLRTDKNPSFGIFKSNKSGQLLFKDQATGQTGNCITFITMLFNITYYKALQKVWKDMCLNNIVITDKGKQVKEASGINTEILILKRNFTKSDDDYWNQFGITRDDLKQYNVTPINAYWINGIKQDWNYSKEDPGYAYFIFDKIKVYRPLADKKSKWRGNAGTYDIQGYEQLPNKCNHIIITKSLKDVIVLNKLGYNAIAPNGENHTIPEAIINKLRKDRETNSFTVFYDNDDAGFKAASKLLAKYEFESLLLSDGEPKDISDYVKLYGLEKAKEWLKINIM